MKGLVTSETYDSHILEQGLEFQVEKYYQPKEISLVRRIKVVLGAIAPKADEKILDVGCGAGTFTYHCAKAKAHSYGIDYSKESVYCLRGFSSDIPLFAR